MLDQHGRRLLYLVCHERANASAYLHVIDVVVLGPKEHEYESDLELHLNHLVLNERERRHKRSSKGNRELSQTSQLFNEHAVSKGGFKRLKII